MEIKKSDMEIVLNEKIRIIPRLDIKGKNLIKGVQLEGLRVIEIQINLQKNIIKKVLMSFFTYGSEFVRKK